MLTVDDANEAKCERKPEMNHPAVCVCVFAPTSSQPFTPYKARCDTLPPLSQTANCI